MLKSSVFVMTLVSLISLPALAADKKTVSLECGGAKATLTCTKFDGDACVASDLAFDTPSGKHVVSPQRKDIKQVFDTPIIADNLSCFVANEKKALIVTYTPGCDYADCQVFYIFTPDGNIFSKHYKNQLKEFFGADVDHLKMAYSVTLRGESK